MASFIGLVGAVVSTAILLAVTYVLVICGYRLVLHPLNKYPGPVLARLSDAYAGYFVLRQKVHLQTARNHSEYGTIIRHGPNRLIFNTTAALQDIYKNDRVAKSFVYDLPRQANDNVHVLNAIDKDVHRRKRRLVGRAINDKAMRDFEPTMVGQINIFMDRVSRSAQSKDPLNVAEIVKQLSIDIVAILGFGYHLKTQTEERDRWLANTLAMANFHINSYMNFPGIRYARVDLIMGLLAGKARERYRELLARMVKSRLSQPMNAQADLFAIVNDEEVLGGEKPLPQSEIFQEAVIFIPAGADTSSTGICATLFYLSRYREAYKQLANEIRSTFASSSEIRGGPKLNGCRYLRACIDEALRMSPPVGGTLWREQQASSKNAGEQLFVDGELIPPGTQVGVSIYALHHNREYFPSPFTYKPDRWLDSDMPEDQRRAMNDAFAAFSVGPRGCAGKAMAYLEMSLVIANLIWSFDFSAAPGKLEEIGSRKAGNSGLEEYELHDIFVSIHDGPYLTFHLRDEVVKKI